MYSQGRKKPEKSVCVPKSLIIATLDDYKQVLQDKLPPIVKPITENSKKKLNRKNKGDALLNEIIERIENNSQLYVAEFDEHDMQIQHEKDGTSGKIVIECEQHISKDRYCICMVADDSTMIGCDHCGICYTSLYLYYLTLSVLCYDLY